MRSSAEDCVSSSSSPESKSLAICSFEQDSKQSVATALPTPTPKSRSAGAKGTETASSSLHLCWTESVQTTPALWSSSSSPSHSSPGQHPSPRQSAQPRAVTQVVPVRRKAISLALLTKQFPNTGPRVPPSPPTQGSRCLPGALSGRLPLTLSKVMSGRVGAVSPPSLSCSEMGSDDSYPYNARSSSRGMSLLWEGVEGPSEGKA